MGLWGGFEGGHIGDLLVDPKPNAATTASPSSAAGLLSCTLSFAYKTSNLGGRGGKRTSPSAALGLASHATLAYAATGGLGTPLLADWGDAFEQAWDREVEVQRVDVDTPPDPRRWHGYSLCKVATKMQCKAICGELQDGAELDPEVLLRSSDGVLEGRADLVVRAPVHEIRDYKTGSVLDDEGAVRRDYRRQLLIYACLEFETVGSWPERIVLVPVGPSEPPQVIEVDQIEAEREMALIRDALSRYNAAVESGDNMVSAASPSPDACRFCSYASGCPAFWAAATEDWRDRGVTAVKGVVERRSAGHGGGSALTIRVAQGTFQSELVTLSPVDEDEQGIRGVAEGDLLCAVRLVRAKDTSARCGPWSEFRFASGSDQA